MAVTLYPTLHEALALHEALLERFGGSLGVRDLGALESALHRPQSGYYEQLSQQAAALLQSLAMNHPFVDGNKRVAFALTAIFLRLNGYRLVVAADAAEAFLIDEVIVARAELAAIQLWLEQHLRSVR
ncbi:MAG TPA: type II toxin-antitoxin system death-on-curing family toxin [Polyangiaceae bacterium]|nr:type II toxin-antitoxin system death-on-curing family toxin [Polyangiaceae bacterium]HMR78404.1 type II toxin-antitoxin system death-on-curing family toxin [Polyangiaceae bacterium]